MLRACDQDDVHRRSEELFQQLRQAVGCPHEASPVTITRINALYKETKSALCNPVGSKEAALPAAQQQLQGSEREEAYIRQYDTRSCQLNSIVCAFRGTAAQEDTLQFIVRDLCEGALLSNLIASGKMLVEDLQLPRLFRDFEETFYAERKLVALCLFFASRRVQFSLQEFQELVDLLKRAQLKLEEVEKALEQSSSQGTMGLAPEQAKQARDQRERLNEFCYIVLMAIGIACYPRNEGLIIRSDLDANAQKKAVAPGGDACPVQEGANSLARSPAFITWLETQLQSTACWSGGAPALAAPSFALGGGAGTVSRVESTLSKQPPYQAMLWLPLAIAHCMATEPDWHGNSLSSLDAKAKASTPPPATPPTPLPRALWGG